MMSVLRMTDLDLRGKRVFIRADLNVPQDDKGIVRGKAAGEGPDIAWFTDPAGNILSVLST